MPCVLMIFAVLFVQACSHRTVSPRLDSEVPKKILWAWERPEDLRFADAKEFGVAFLAQTLVMQGPEIIYKPRRQPLEISSGAYVIAVTRVETVKDAGKRPSFNDDQRARLVQLIKATIDRPHVRAVQVDFDAVASERKFYGAMMKDLRAALPENISLTMTSLASWCVGDAWFNDFPVDEAVPMAFDMGADDENIKNFLARGNDWSEPLCRGSYGISLDDPLKMELKPDRRIYYFKNGSWSSSDLNRIK